MGRSGYLNAVTPRHGRCFSAGPAEGWAPLVAQGKGETVNRRILAASLSVAAGLFILTGSALADPGGPNLQTPGTMVCDNGVTVTVNPGTATNQGRPAWVVDDTTVFIAAYFAVTDGDFTFVFFDHTNGLKNPTTCTRDVGGGVTFVATGFFTPR